MRSQTLDVLEHLIAFNTVSANSNLGMIRYIEAFLKERGFCVTLLPDDTGQKAGLYAEYGPQGAGILLSGHTDVVPVEGQNWTHEPFRLTRGEGERFYGRGTTDMKGYLACMLSAAAEAANARLKEPLKLVFSYDEEVGCVGIGQMLERLTPLLGAPRACFVGEPTMMNVATGHKGKTALSATCHGQGGHSAMAPDFVNALHLAADFIVSLRALQDDISRHGVRDCGYNIPYSTLHVGCLSGGTALNIVPDTARMDFEFRHLAADSTDALLSRIRDAAVKVEESYRPRWGEARIDIRVEGTYPGLDVSTEAPVTALARSLSGGELTKVPYGTEAGYFASIGIPTVVCGPGSMEDQGHKPDEYIALEQLMACERMMGEVIRELS